MYSCNDFAKDVLGGRHEDPLIRRHNTSSGVFVTDVILELAASLGKFTSRNVVYLSIVICARICFIFNNFIISENVIKYIYVTSCVSALCKPKVTSQRITLNYPQPNRILLPKVYIHIQEIRDIIHSRYLQ